MDKEQQKLCDALESMELALAQIAASLKEIRKLLEDI